jgi:glutaredoxin
MMSTATSMSQIRERISELKRLRESVEGTPTEVYTRIVGYYRSLKNWNRGKRSEYNERQTFRGPADARESEASHEPIATAPTLQPVVLEPRRAVAETRVDVLSPQTGGDEGLAPAATRAATAVAAPPEVVTASYEFYSRRTCPTCRGVAKFLGDTEYSGVTIDADTKMGREMAEERGVLSTPTVILFDEADREIARAGDLRGLKDYLS